jgi:excisionase family DNA binding protein
MARPKLSASTAIPGRLDRDVYTIRELAVILDLHPAVLQKAIRQGELQANFIGGSAGYRILHDQVIKWLKSRGREPAITNPDHDAKGRFTPKTDAPAPPTKTSSRRARA